MRWGKSITVSLSLILLMGLRTAFAAGATPATDTAADPQRILVLGDSLSAEYGLPRESGWVRLVEQRLADSKQAYQIRNASISGDTSIGGLQRLPGILKEFKADIVILQLGANDGLRGQPVAGLKENLIKLVDISHAAGAEVLLVGQHIPPNYGQRYAQSFHQSFADVAEETGAALVPFMLEGIATNLDMFQPDGLHPTVEAQPIIADTIWAHLQPMLHQETAKP